MHGSNEASDPVEVLARKLSQQKKLAAVVAVIFFSVLGLWGFYQQMKVTSYEKARSEWFRAESAFDAQFRLLTTPSKQATDGKSGTAEPTSSQKWLIDTVLAQELEAVQKVATSGESTPSSFEAKLLLGQTYFRYDAAPDALQKAANWFKKAVDQNLDPERKATALYQLAFVQEAQGDLDIALGSVSSALTLSPESAIRGDLLKFQGRLAERLGKKDVAIQAYDQIIKNYPQSELVRFAEQRKAALSP